MFCNSDVKGDSCWKDCCNLPISWYSWELLCSCSDLRSFPSWAKDSEKVSAVSSRRLKGTRMLPTKPLSPSMTLALDNRTSFAAGSNVARYRFAFVAGQASEYHSYKNIGGYVTTAPSTIEVFRRRCGHCFVYCFPTRN